MEEDTTELEGVQTGGAMEEEGEEDLLVLDPSHVCLDIVDIMCHEKFSHSPLCKEYKQL